MRQSVAKAAMAITPPTRIVEGPLSPCYNGAMRKTAPALLAILLLAACGGTPAKPTDFNLLLVTIDTLRPDRLSCYSQKFVQTPQADSLAARGVLFERAFSHAPLTLPSHTNILLGATSSAHGVDDNGKCVVPREFPSMAKTLKAGGYTTGAFVSAFPLDSRFGLNEGFDVYDDKYPSRAAAALDYPERPAGQTVAAALAWLSAQRGKWFLWVHLFDPHAPYSPPEPYATRYAGDPYSGEAAYADEALGELLRAVDARGETGRTLFILTADHGESLGEHGEMTHGYFAYNSTIWVPLIVAGPGLSASRVKDAAGHVDIFPTACDLLGLETPPSLHGRSLRPLLEGRSRKPRPIAFEAMEGYLHKGAAPLRGLIDGGMKYFDSPLPELYDLRTDFDEKSDLSPGAGLGPYKKKLAAKLAADASPLRDQAVRRTDRETTERLRSLGYTAAPAAPPRKDFGPADDLKTLLPFERKLVEAAGAAKAGDPARGAALLEELVRARPDFARAYVQLAELHFAEGRTEAYLQTLERGAQANPGDFTTVSTFGRALVEQGLLDRAVEVLGRALGIFDQDADVWGALAEAHWKKGDGEKAFSCFQTALGLAPGDAVINGNLGNFYVARGVKTRNIEDIRASFAYFERALAVDPSLASVHNGLGGAHKINGNAAEAIASWERAAALDPNYDLPVYNLGLAFLEQGDKAKALGLFRRYLDIKGPAVSDEERREVDSLIERCRR